ncbi:hypothetical protein Bhyg_02063, partial [Pseudolycoriella hygida]
MSQIKQKQQQKGKGIIEQADHLSDERAVTQQWMFNTLVYSDHSDFDSIPTPPPPPDISDLLCYNEPDDELDTFRNRINAPRSEFTCNTNYNSSSLNHVKTEPEKELVSSSTKSSLYCGAHVGILRNQENLSQRYNLLNRVKIEPEPSTSTFLSYDNRPYGHWVSIESSKNIVFSPPYQYPSESKQFECLLPILSRTKDWSRNKDRFFWAVDRLCAAIHFCGSRSEKVFKVCASLMNNAVVKLMENNKNEVNDEYINSLLDIYWILHRYGQDEAELIESSNKALKNFMSSATARVKMSVPNLGEFLVHLTVSTLWTWTQISKVFMYELDARLHWQSEISSTLPGAHECTSVQR